MFKISVVIPTLNRASLLARTLDHVEGQSLSRDHYEVIVVDNNSSDDTSSLLEQKAGTFPNLRFAVQRKPGAAAARNTGLGMASGNIVLFIDDDIEADPLLLESHLAYHRDNPNASIIGTIRTRWENSRDPFLRYLRDRRVFNPYSVTSDSIDFSYYHTGNASSSREMLVEEGGFDEQFAVYGMEDIELGYRLEKRGCRMVPGVDAVAIHHYSPTYDEFTERCQQAGYSLGLMLRLHPELRERFTENGRMTKVLKPLHRLYSFAAPLIQPVCRSLAHLDKKRGTGSVTAALGFHYDWALRYYFFLGYSRYGSNGHSKPQVMADQVVDEVKTEKPRSKVHSGSLVP